MSEPYEPLTVSMNIKGRKEGIIAVLESTIQGLRSTRGKLHLKLQVKEEKKVE